MRNIRFAGILVLIAVLMSMAFSANAGGAGPTIRANETFDGSVVFLDQNWGITGGWTGNNPDTGVALPITRGNRTLGTYTTAYNLTPGVDGTSLTLGLSLAYVDGASTSTDIQPTGDIDPETGLEDKTAIWVPKTRTFTNTGAVVTDRAFSGTKSLKLTSTTKLSMTNMDEAGLNNQPWFHQFALAVGPTGGQAAGVVLGSFKLNFKTASIQNLLTTSPDVNKTVQIDAVTKAGGDVDLIVKPTNKVVGTISPVLGSWANISVLTKLDCALTPTSSTPTPNNWGAFDAVSTPLNVDGGITTITKGPEDMYRLNQTTTSLYYSGVTIFVNSKTKSAYLSPLDIDSSGKWGTKTNDQVATSGLRRNQATTLVSFAWETKGATGASPIPGTLYVDDLLWGFPPSGRSSYQDPNNAANYIGQEMALRMNEFTDKSVETPAAAVKVWNVY